MDFQQDFSIKGTWWLPMQQDKAVLGELTYKVGGRIKLNTLGSLRGIKSIYETQSNQRFDSILGVAQDGKCFSLLNAFGHELGTSRLIETHYDIDYVLSDTKYTLDYPADRFDQITIHFNCSDEFFFGLYKRLEPRRRPKDGKLSGFKFSPAKQKLLYSEADQRCFLHFAYSSSHSRSRNDGFVFTQSVIFNLAVTKPVGFDQLIIKAENLKSLFSFFSNKRIYFTKMSVKETSSKKYFDVVFPQNVEAGIEKLSSFDLLIEYKTMKTNFEKVLKWWMTNEEFVSNGLSIYMQFINAKLQSKPHQFLSVVFALETLHVSFFDRKIFSDKQMEKFKKDKASFKTSAQFTKRMNECLSTFNSMSFSKRIKDLIGKNRSILIDYLYDIPDFIKRLTSQRNFYAHDHSGGTRNLIPDEHLEYFIFMGKLVYDLSLMGIAGFSRKNIALIVERDMLMQYYKDRKPDLVSIKNK